MSISLNDHERRIKDFEGKIVEIGDRIDNVVANAKDWAIVTTSTPSISSRTVRYTIPSEYSDGYDFVVISYFRVFARGAGSIPSSSITINSKNSFSGSGGSTPSGSGNNSATVTVSFSKSGNTIIASISPYNACKDSNLVISKDALTVLFYK